MTKILIPVELEDGKSCEGCPCFYTAPKLGHHVISGPSNFCIFFALHIYDEERPTRCIKELG